MYDRNQTTPKNRFAVTETNKEQNRKKKYINKITRVNDHQMSDAVVEQTH